jgi:hypothetical protein
MSVRGTNLPTYAMQQFLQLAGVAADVSARTALDPNPTFVATRQISVAMISRVKSSRSRSQCENDRRLGRARMGADVFIALYGVKIAISRSDEDALDALGARTEPRLRDARQHGLHVYWGRYWGRLTDGEDYFLYVSHQIGLPGCARLSTKPEPTGSPTVANTIGTVLVA